MRTLPLKLSPMPPMIEIVSAISLWELVKHASTWVRNLRRAGEARKSQSRQALRRVILAANETRIYLAHLGATQQRSSATEARLRQLWLELSFALEDLELDALAARCRITGSRWTEAGKIDPATLAQADSGLARLESMARKLLRETRNRKPRSELEE